jgi:GAF domain-containing protein
MPETTETTRRPVYDEHRRTGTEPRIARSPLRLRFALSVLFLPLFIAGTVLFALWSADSTPNDSPSDTALATVAGICAALALVAAVDLLIIVRRLRAERR